MWRSLVACKRRGWRDFDNFHDGMGRLESTEGVSVLSEMSALGYLHGLSCWKQEVTPNALFISHFKNQTLFLPSWDGATLGPQGELDADFPNLGT
jgi:hypothetical protein